MNSRSHGVGTLDLSILVRQCGRATTVAARDGHSEINNVEPPSLILFLSFFFSLPLLLRDEGSLHTVSSSADVDVPVLPTAPLLLRGGRVGGRAKRRRKKRDEEKGARMKRTGLTGREGRGREKEQREETPVWWNTVLP